MPPPGMGFGDRDWPAPGERSVHSCGDPHRIEIAVSRAPIGFAIAIEADERMALGHLYRSEAI